MTGLDKCSQKTVGLPSLKCGDVPKVHGRGMRQGDWILDLICHDWRGAAASVAGTNQALFHQDTPHQNATAKHNGQNKMVIGSDNETCKYCITSVGISKQKNWIPWAEKLLGSSPVMIWGGVSTMPVAVLWPFLTMNDNNTLICDAMITILFYNNHIW